MTAKDKPTRPMAPCPACGEHTLHPFPNMARNSTSRYQGGIYICPGCGVREAFEGHFWAFKAER